jgi:hypothetical protein
MRIGWLVNEDNFERALSLRNGPHLPTTHCACAEFEDFAKQRNSGGGREKDLFGWWIAPALYHLPVSHKFWHF